MKTKLLLLFLLGWAGAVCGQDNVKSGGNYYFNHIPRKALAELDNSSTKFENNKDKITDLLDGNDYNIQVTKIEEGRVYFVFGKFGKDELENKINKMNFSENDSIQKNNTGSAVPNNPTSTPKVVYSLKLDAFEKNTKPLYNRIEYRIGAYTVPFKLRLKNFAFDSNINIGANIGGKIRWNRRVENGFALEPIFGFGLSNIKLDDSNSTATTTTNVSAFTFNTGVLIHVTNNINCGITYGFDNIS